MNTYKINQLSQYAYKILETAEEAHVHSVYNKTINLDVKGQLLALQVQGSPLSPISLITNMEKNQLEHLHLQINQRLSIKDLELRICQDKDSNPTSLSYKQAKLTDLRLSPCSSKTQLEHLKLVLQEAIASSHTNGFDMIFSHAKEVDNNLILMAARTHLLSIQEILEKPNTIHRKTTETVIRELTKLIGLGIGLTPSGDDFLTGILAGITLCDQNNTSFATKLKNEIKKHLWDTNDISRAFLTCALKGQFSGSIQMLQECPDADATTIHETFLRIGHSSGIDTLCGIYYHLNLLAKYLNN